MNQSTSTNSDPVILYGKLKTQIANLEEQLEFIKPTVTEVILKLKEDNDDPEAPVTIPDLGSFNTQIRTTYKYSDEITEKEAELKKLKKEEVKMGIAEAIEESTVLVFKRLKE